MEAFHLLSRGGAVFDKKKFKSDVQLFNVSSPVNATFGAAAHTALLLDLCDCLRRHQKH